MSEYGRKKERSGNPVAPPERLTFRSCQKRKLERLLDSEALLVILVPLLALFVGHLVDKHPRALELDAPYVVQLPHLRVIEDDVRLRDQGIVVVADVAEILEHVLEVPTVVQGLPLALAGQPAHGRCRTSVVLLAEGDLVRPVAGLGAVGPPLVVDEVEYGILADHARDHARPAATRIHVAGVLERYRL